MAKCKSLSVTRVQLAELLGVHANHVTRLVSQGMPVESTGGGRGRPTMFDAAAALAWVREREHADGPGSTPSIRDEYLIALRDRVRQDVAMKAGTLISRDDVVSAGQHYTRTWRGMLLALPTQLVVTGAIEKAQKPAVEAGCRQLLTEISRWQVPADSPQSPAPAQPERKKKK